MQIAHRRAWLIGVLLALQVAAAAAFLSLFWGDDAGLTPLAEAAHRTSEYPGARLTFEGRLDVPGAGTVLTMEGHGEYNGATGLSRIVLDMDPPAEVASQFLGGRIQIEQLGEERPGTVMSYTRSVAFGPLPGGAQWLKIDQSEHVDAQMQSFDPRDQLEMLRSTDDFRRVGAQRVRGAPTTRYRATIDYRDEIERLRDEGQDSAAETLEKVVAANDGADSEPVEAWVAGDKTIRRLRMWVPFSMGMWPKGTTILLTLELYDFGIEPEIDLPDESQVFDATEIARQELDRLAE
jgi:hypothetical protein